MPETLNIPSLSTKVDPETRRAFDAIKSWAAKGSVLSVEDMVGAGIVTVSGGSIVPAIPSLNTTVPPPLQNFTVTGAFNSIMVDWDDPNYANLAKVEIWRAAEDNFGIAIKVGETLGNVYADTPPDTATSVTYWYWGRIISQAGIAGPFNSVNGTPGSTANDPSYLLEILTDQLTESQLHADLTSRIDLIDDPYTGLMARVAAQQSQLDELAMPLFDEAHATPYLLDQKVRYGGNVYNCILETSVPPEIPSNTTYWELIGVYVGDAATQAAESATAAATHAAAALAYRDAAGDHATSAQAAKVSAQTAAGNAATSAGNASASAGQSATSATNAAGSANTAGSYATAAATSSTNAANSATAASTSASQAATSSTQAGSYSTASQASAVSAATTRDRQLVASSGVLFVDPLNEIFLGYTAVPNSTTGLTAGATFAQAANTSGNGSGYALSVTGDPGWMSTRKMWPVTAGRTYRAKLVIKKTAYDGYALYSGLAYFDANQSLITSDYSLASNIAMTESQGWTTYTFDYVVPTATPQCKFIRVMARVQYPNGAGQSQIAQMSVEDVTESAAALVYKNAAASAAITAEGHATASAQDYAVVAARLNNFSGSGVSVETKMTATANSVTGLQGQYTVKVDSNGYVAGYGLATTATTGVPTAEFAIVADKFSIAPVPTNPAAADGSPFFYLTAPTVVNGVTVPAGAYMKAAFIADATIARAMIQNAAIDSARISDLAVVTAKIADAAITTAKIGSAQITTALIANAAVGTAQIQNAAIGTAQIQNAAIGTAQIGDAQVDTLKIAGEAVTVPVSAYTAASMTAEVETTAQTVVINTGGNPVVVTCGANIRGGSTGSAVGGNLFFSSVTVRVYRDGTLIYNTDLLGGSFNTGGGRVATSWSATLKDTPAVGGSTYSFTVTAINGGTVANRCIVALGVKR